MSNSGPNFYTSPPDPLNMCLELFKSGELYKGLSLWFTLDEAIRGSVAKDAILAAGTGQEKYAGEAIDTKAVNPKQAWLLENFSILTSPTSEKLFTPYAEFNADDDTKQLFGEASRICAFHRWDDYIHQLHHEGHRVRDKWDHGSWISVASFIRQNFSTDDMHKLLTNIVDRLPADPELEPESEPEPTKLSVPEEQRIDFFNYQDGIVDPFRHADLMLDEELMSRLPAKIFSLDSRPLGEWISEFLGRCLYPKAQTIEKLMAAHAQEAPSDFLPDNSNAPVGAFYFALIRRIAHIEVKDNVSSSSREADQATYHEIVARICGYLLNGEIMAEVDRFIDSDITYDDVPVDRGFVDRLSVAGGFAGKVGPVNRAQIKKQKADQLREVIYLVSR
jgi:hypothetical protein